MGDFAIVVAVDRELGIGKAGSLPWRLPADMAHFKQLTREAPAPLQNAVIMGRKTYASITPRFRPLTGRLNVVLSRTRQAHDAPVLGAVSLEAALALLDARKDVHRVFVIGGGEIYREAIQSPCCKQLHVTRIEASFESDTHFPQFAQAFLRVTQSGPKHDSGINYTFEVYERRV